MEAEAASVRNRRQRRGPARVTDPLGHDECLTLGSGGDCAVRNAQQDDLGVVLAQRDAPLLEASGDGRADTATADHVHGFDRHWLQFRFGYRARRSLAPGEVARAGEVPKRGESAADSAGWPDADLNTFRVGATVKMHSDRRDGQFRLAYLKSESAVIELER